MHIHYAITSFLLPLMFGNDLCFLSLICLFWVFHVSGLEQHLTFCVWHCVCWVMHLCVCLQLLCVCVHVEAQGGCFLGHTLIFSC